MPESKRHFELRTALYQVLKASFGGPALAVISSSIGMQPIRRGAWLPTCSFGSARPM